MIQQLLFQIIFLFWATIVSAQAPAITKPNCPSRCGNVTIPFPFGTKAGCYADDWFAIDCISGKPFPRSIKLEVLEISLATNTMQVNHQVFNSCQEQTTSASVDLEATPFTFSNSSNSFTSIACNNFAYISMVDSVVIGCSSLCDSNTNRIYHNSYCSGINCCQATIPSPLKKFNTSVFAPDGGTQDECLHAFLVDQNWLGTKFRNSQDVQGIKYVPVVLDWGIFTSSLFPSRSAESAKGFYNGQHFYCRASANTTSSSQLSIVQCYCDYGYNGNPYLPQGCQRKLSANGGGPSDDAWVILAVILYGSPCLLGLIIFVALVRLCCRIRKRMKRKEKFFRRNGGLLLQQRLTSSDGSVDKSKLFNTKELRKATDNFNINRILGQGGQGTVYKGMLADGTIVAIKKSKVVDEGKLVLRLRKCYPSVGSLNYSPR